MLRNASLSGTAAVSLFPVWYYQNLHIENVYTHTHTYTATRIHYTDVEYDTHRVRKLNNSPLIWWRFCNSGSELQAEEFGAKCNGTELFPRFAVSLAKPITFLVFYAPCFSKRYLITITMHNKGATKHSMMIPNTSIIHHKALTIKLLLLDTLNFAESHRQHNDTHHHTLPPSGKH